MRRRNKMIIMDNAVSLRNISKSFYSRSVLKNINLEVKRGEIFALLGINGAGKTTLIRIILGFLHADSGKVMLGNSVSEESLIRDKVGYLPENFFPPPQLKARELLRALTFFNSIKQRTAEDLLKIVGLEKEADKYLGFYSRGMIQRFGLALCLLKNPDIIIMDEPTLGLDILGQKQMFELMASLRREGRTIIFSSHILSQVQTVADRVGVINEGEITFCGKIEEMLKFHSTAVFEEAFLREIKKL